MMKEKIDFSQFVGKNVTEFANVDWTLLTSGLGALVDQKGFRGLIREQSQALKSLDLLTIRGLDGTVPMAGFQSRKGAYHRDRGDMTVYTAAQNLAPSMLGTNINLQRLDIPVRISDDVMNGAVETADSFEAFLMAELLKAMSSNMEHYLFNASLTPALADTPFLKGSNGWVNKAGYNTVAPPGTPLTQAVTDSLQLALPDDYQSEKKVLIIHPNQLVKFRTSLVGTGNGGPIFPASASPDMLFGDSMKVITTTHMPTTKAILTVEGNFFYSMGTGEVSRTRVEQERVVQGAHTLLNVSSYLASGCYEPNAVVITTLTN